MAAARDGPRPESDMARMFPSPMRRDTESEAERFLYRKFEEELPGDYTVLHGARWVSRRPGERGRDGEVDFLVLHPSRGILVLEAKGGRVYPDGRRGVWVSEGGGEVRDLPRSPMEQALVSKKVLLDLFLYHPRLGRRLLHLVHAIALPHVTVPPEGLGPDAPRSRVMDATDVQDLGGWVRRALESADEPPVKKPELGEDGVDWIVELVAPRRRLPIHTPTVAEAAAQRFAELTDEQFEVLHMLANVPRARIAGGPGTGKTLLAVETARRFATQGLRTLLVCFNIPLAQALREQTQDVPGLTVSHFHGLCEDLAKEAGLSNRIREAAAAQLFDEGFPDVLVEAMARLECPYDAIVVDEGQDFRRAWWDALEMCQRDGAEGRLFVFEDEGQSVHHAEEPYRPPGLVGPVPIRKNCRNPVEIHELLIALPGGPADLQSSGVSVGIRPRLTWVRDERHVPHLVNKAVSKLRTTWGVSPGEIAVLTPSSPSRSALGAVERLGDAPASWRTRTSPDHVLVDTIHRFKGLETPAVVLCEIVPGLIPDTVTFLTIGASRATVHLDLLATPEVSPLLGPALDTLDVVNAGSGSPDGEPTS